MDKLLFIEGLGMGPGPIIFNAVTAVYCSLCLIGSSNFREDMQNNLTITSKIP
jgi:hypothetical protein